MRRLGEKDGRKGEKGEERKTRANTSWRNGKRTDGNRSRQFMQPLLQVNASSDTLRYADLKARALRFGAHLRFSAVKSGLSVFPFHPSSFHPVACIYFLLATRELLRPIFHAFIRFLFFFFYFKIREIVLFAVFHRKVFLHVRTF